MQIIKLDSVPNQSFTFNTENNVYGITIKECSGAMGVSVIKNEKVLIENVRALSRVFLIPYGYLNLENFAFITQNDELPYYPKFDFTQQLIYLNKEDIESLS